MLNAYLNNTLQFNKDLCNNCIMCTTVCPHEVFERKNKIVSLRRIENCMECGASQLNCPTGAIQWVEGGQLTHLRPRADVARA